jgi:hypothetical protein
MSQEAGVICPRIIPYRLVKPTKTTSDLHAPSPPTRYLIQASSEYEAVFTIKGRAVM